MDAETRAWVERRFRIPDARTDKRTTLAGAVAAHVRAGDTLHLGMTHARYSAACSEVLRRYHGSDPAFTLLVVTATTPFAPLVHAGLARKVVTSWAGDSFWSPGPSAVFQRAWAEGLEFEQWSILTFAQRLEAAARGLPYMATRSLVGSSIAERNHVEVREDGVALVPALVPDVSIFHAPAADAQGNVLFSPPLMENVWGALAARRGCIVTVDRIVDPSFVRAHAHLTRIPASAVLAVVEAPYGAHPGGVAPAGIEDGLAYAEDYEHWVDLRHASKDPALMDAWIKEWVLEPDTHERYLEKLGAPRLEGLRRRAARAGAFEELEHLVAELDLEEPPNAVETAIVTTSRVLADAVRANGYTAMLAGAGMANLGAWLAAYALADDGVDVQLVAEMGLVGYWPVPGEPLLFNQRNFPACTMLADIGTALGIVVGGGSARAIGALGAAQVDRVGNINSTEVPGEYLLMGSGGANDVITAARESVVVCAQSRERMLERVPYVTGPGDRVRTLVTTLGVYRKDADGELVLTEVFGPDVVAAARECRERCGWDLRVAPGLRAAASPTREEIRTLRFLDPRGLFRG